MTRETVPLTSSDQPKKVIAINIRKPTKSNAMRLHGAGLLSDDALTQLFATRPHWRHT